MKTFAEVAQWHVGAAEAFDDPAEPVCQLFFRWQSDLSTGMPGSELTCGIANDKTYLLIGPEFPSLPIEIQIGEPEISREGQLVKFGAAPIAPGVWSLSPSMNARGLIHGFVVLYGVP